MAFCGEKNNSLAPRYFSTLLMFSDMIKALRQKLLNDPKHDAPMELYQALELLGAE